MRPRDAATSLRILRSEVRVKGRGRSSSPARFVAVRTSIASAKKPVGYYTAVNEAWTRVQRQLAVPTPVQPFLSLARSTGLPRK
jgi:hypothetical protein